MVCITKRITVLRDHPSGHQNRRTVLSGCRSIAAIHFNGRVSRVPSPVIAVKSRLIASPFRP
jgi:hypothetical protein